MATRARLVWGMGCAVAGLGGGLFLFRVWPSEEARSERLRKDFPEPVQYYSEAQRQNALIMEILKKAATTDENVARKPLSWKK